MSSSPPAVPNVAEDDSRIARRRRAAKAGGGEVYAAKRRELIEAAAAVFRERGYDAASLNDVAARLGTDRASLYYYVSGKEELLLEAVREGVAELVHDLRLLVASDAGAPDKLRAFVRTLTVSLEDHYPLQFIWMQQDMDEVFRQRNEAVQETREASFVCEGLLMQVLEQGVREGSFQSWVPADLTINALFGMVNWSHRWFRPGHGHTAAEIAEHFSGLLLTGMEKSR